MRLMARERGHCAVQQAGGLSWMPVTHRDIGRGRPHIRGVTKRLLDHRENHVYASLNHRNDCGGCSFCTICG